MNISNSSIPRQRSGVQARLMADGSWTFYDRERLVLHATNGLAGFIYQQCNGQLNIAKIAAIVAAHIGSQQQHALQHTQYIIQEFISAGMIELLPEGPEEDA